MSKALLQVRDLRTHFETRAVSLGYKPPPRLSNRGY